MNSFHQKFTKNIKVRLSNQTQSFVKLKLANQDKSTLLPTFGAIHGFIQMLNSSTSPSASPKGQQVLRHPDHSP